MSPFCSVIFLGFCSVLSFGSCFFVFSFWQPPCVCFYVLVGLLHLLGRVALCSRCLVGPSGTASPVREAGGDSDLASACTCLLCDGGVTQQRSSGLCQQVCLGESCPPALTLISDASLPPPVSLVPFELLSWCWSSTWSWCWGWDQVPVHRPFKRNCLGLQPPTHLASICTSSHSQRLGGLTSQPWNPGQAGGPGVGLEPLAPQGDLCS